MTIYPIGDIMGAGWMPHRSSRKTPSTMPAGVLYHERFHLKFLFMESKLAAVLIGASIFFLWLFNVSMVGALTPAVTKSAPATEHVDGGLGGEMLTAILQSVIDAVGAMFSALAEQLPVVDISWLSWLPVAWWLFVVWAIARSWYRWYKSYAEVSMNGFTIYTPKSFWFALGTKGNRTVPAAMVFDADEASSIIDNTIFMKTVSRVNVFVKDTAGEDDAVRVPYARYADDLIGAVKQIARINASVT